MGGTFQLASFLSTSNLGPRIAGGGTSMETYIVQTPNDLRLQL